MSKLYTKQEIDGLLAKERKRYDDMFRMQLMLNETMLVNNKLAQMEIKAIRHMAENTIDDIDEINDRFFDAEECDDDPNNFLGIKSGTDNKRFNL